MNEPRARKLFPCVCCRRAPLIVTVVMLLIGPAGAQDESREMFDGKSLDGWETLKEDGWNEYRIRAEGPRIRSWINDVPALDYQETDASIPLDGLIGIQVHGGGKTLVHVMDVTVRELPPTPNSPTWKKVGLPKTAWPKVQP